MYKNTHVIFEEMGIGLQGINRSPTKTEADMHAGMGRVIRPKVQLYFGCQAFFCQAVMAPGPCTQVRISYRSTLIDKAITLDKPLSPNFFLIRLETGTGLSQNIEYQGTLDSPWLLPPLSPRKLPEHGML